MTENPIPARRSGNLLFGLLALIPAIVLLLTGYLVPTVRTVLASFTDASLLSKPSESVGLENYSDIGGRFGESLVGPLVLAVALTFAALVGGVLAWLAARAGRPARWTLRAAFALPMAAVGSAVAAVSWLLAFKGAPVNAGLAQFAAFVGLVVGLGATGYLLVFRHSTRLSDTWPGTLLVTGVVAATSLAYAVQSFAFPLLLVSRDSPRGSRTPSMLIFDTAFRFARLGQASAGAVLLWLLLAVLGLGVAVWLIMARARVEAAEPEQPVDGQAAGQAAWRVVSVLATVVAVLVALAGLVPLLLHSFDFPTRAMGSGVLPHLVSTWVPPLLSTGLGVVAAALAGYGIGALRPLGRLSGLLLLPFAPWLFTGLPVLTPDAFAHRGEDGTLFLTLIPPASLSIPVLFGSALLFAGVRWTRALPVVAAAGLLVWVTAAQDLWWPLIVSLEPDDMPVQVLLVQVVNRFAGPDGAPTGWAYPLPVLLLVAAAIAAVQIFVLDRLVLRTGREEPVAAEVPPLP
ncbi:hypothetical protein Cs7R123_66290 [Catellatospora sp. TT07R-123]|uniref:sugar ABC transporter permease n=1 Tax=Catellatospora sp. TT07R-123 TaxID=2733863 RepID=UPI001B203215|nr:sugar ABC transporter permease [Catellatospora sp. TT07R-123]GHJ49287.1 hypothetical protein Cs7R123_66290 [Catellatospora sp. TT07R-123]